MEEKVLADAMNIVESRLSEDEKLKRDGKICPITVTPGPTGRLTKNQKEAIRRRKRREAAEKARKI